MSNNINGVQIPGNHVEITIPADADGADIDRILAQAQRDAQDRGGASITVVGNGRNVSARGGHAGNNQRR